MIDRMTRFLRGFFIWTFFIPFVILFIIILLLYSPSLGGTFILDDYVWVQPVFGSQIIDLFTGSWEHGNTLRPIMRLEFAFNRFLFGENPVGWRMINIFLHTLVAWSLYIILYKISRKKFLAISGAVIFAVFPSHHESVAWISGQTHPFGLLLSLGAGFLLYQSCLISKFRLIKFIVGSFFLLLAFLTYEVSFVIPIALLFTFFLIVENRDKYGYLVILASFLELGILLFYRFLVLGGTMGNVGEHQSNILLAPFFNIKQIIDLYWYNKELKILILALTIFIFYLLINARFWKNFNDRWKWIVLFVIFSILAYSPFAIVRGVAPRFLYSSLFFSTIVFFLLYDYIANLNLLKIYKVFFGIVFSSILVISFYQTWQTANHYRQIADAYEKIRQIVVQDYPIWPKNVDMLFYGVPDSIQFDNQYLLAFITYFDKAIHFGYTGQNVGIVYRAEKLSDDKVRELRAKEVIEYMFLDLQNGVKMLDVNTLSTGEY